MIYVGIDVAKDKHDCYIVSGDGEVLPDVFTVPNNRDGKASVERQGVLSVHLLRQSPWNSNTPSA